MDIQRIITYADDGRIPIHFGILPRVWIEKFDDMQRLAGEYPQFIPRPPASIADVRAHMAPRYRVGTWYDEWGCRWDNISEGNDAICLGHPVPRREDIRTLQIPQNVDGSLPHGFMYLRLLDLRGFEEAMIDFAEECDELQILIDKVLQYNCIQMQYLIDRGDRRIQIGDDLGMQTGLAIGAEKWRRYLTPCFSKIFGIAKKAGALVYMHTDGCIWEIMPDLYACGADVINPQFRANGLDNLVRVCKGKIPIDLDLDRQMFPFATPAQLDEHVRQAVEALWLPKGGLGLSIELDYEVPVDNMAALFEAARKYQDYHGHF